MRLSKAILAAAVIITLCGCAESNTDEIPADTAETAAVEIADIPDGYTLFEKPTNAINDTVTMEIINADDTSAKVKITNNLDREIDMDYCVFEIQKKINNDWYSLPYIEQIDGFIGHANVIESQCSRDFDRDWENLYGKLEQGDYRIVTYFMTKDESSGRYITDYQYYLSAEFEID